MKVTRPEETVQVCDFCERDGYLERCLVCGKEYCLTCRGIITGCWVQPRVCRECCRREDVSRLVAEYAGKITPIIEARHEALSAMEET